jgi:hypothetical protein
LSRLYLQRLKELADSDKELAGWKQYEDRRNRFNFSYPPIFVEKHVGDSLELSNSFFSETLISVHIGSKWNLESYAGKGPTGIEDPPEPQKIGTNVFYYWGPGGGGVSYPDQYYYNLNGKELYFGFDGPYINDKTPCDWMKSIEKKILESFHVL